MNVVQLLHSLCPGLDELEQKLASLLKSGLKRRGIVRTMWRWGTGARSSVQSHSDQRSCFFFSHEGQNERPRQENATMKLSRQDSQ